jgi:HAD superfamily hydrolase (TIGR01509 family)
MTDLRAVVFDFDGLILDTETAIYTAWTEAFVAHGCEPPTLDEWAQEIGTVSRLNLEEMLRTRATVPVDFDAMHRTRRARHDELIAREAVLPGVMTWIADAQHVSMAIAIASSSRHAWVHGNLERLGIRHHFEHISCRAEGVPPKPAPDVYLRACAALRVAPAEALAVEDSPNGVAAAKAAGLRCVAVPNGVTTSFDFGGADLVVSSLADCSLHEAIAALVR